MEEAMLVLQIMDMAWMEDADFPTTRLLSKRLGKSEPTVRLYLRSLEMKGMLKPKRSGRHYDYDWTPLVEAIRELPEIDFSEKKETEDGGFVDQSKGSLSLHELMNASMRVAEAKSQKRKAVKAHNRVSKLDKFNTKAPCDYNSNDLEFVISESWIKKGWNTPPPRFYPKDRKLSKQLLENYGAVNCDKVIRGCIAEWEAVSATFRIQGYPSVGVFWGFRNSLFPYILDNNNSKPQWGSKFDKKDERSEGSEIGW